MSLNEKERAAQIFQERMSRQNSNELPPMPKKRVTFNPNLTMGQSGLDRSIPHPVPSKLPYTDRVTQSSGKIPRDMDPVHFYKNLTERSTASAKSGEEKGDFQNLKEIFLILLAILVISMNFAIPENFKIFWLIFSIFFILAIISHRIYIEILSNNDEKLASTFLYGSTILISSVILIFSFVFCYKLYAIYQTKTKL